MRLALAQIDATVGDFAGNVARIRAAARDVRADLVVFPELAICGYMPRDLLEEASFVDAAARALEGLAADRSLPPLLVGCPLRAGGPGKPLWNAAALVRGGSYAAVHKRLLPTYDVFDERRWFRPGAASRPFEVAGARVGVLICEDSWNDVAERYDADPVADLAAAGAQLVVNLSASPYERGKPEVRREILARHARRTGLPQAISNLVGADDQLVFDGGSFAVDGAGVLCAHAACWREDVVVTDFSGRAAPPADADDVLEALVLGVRGFVAKTGHARVLLGLSGGIDSALVACIAARALGPENVAVVAMPGPFSADASLQDARAIADALGVRIETVPIGDAYRRVRADLAGDAPFSVADENLQARLRGMALMYFANRDGALVLATGNKSELATGYCTLYGDMAGALAPIGDVYKTDVYALARRFSDVIPPRVFSRPPSAELRPDQTDQDTLPEYAVLDAILRLHVEDRLSAADIAAAGHDPAVAEAVVRSVARAEHKRQQAAPVLKVSRKAFGLGRRYPIAASLGYS